MNREEEINNASHQLYNDYAYRSLIDIFKFGAQWADANPVNSWIKIDSSLPEDFISHDDIMTEKVLVRTSYETVMLTYRWKNVESDVWSWKVSKHLQDKITHWMPIPSTYNI